MRLELMLSVIFWFAGSAFAQDQHLFFLHKKYDAKVEMMEIPNTQAGMWRVCHKMKQQFIRDLRNRREVMVAGGMVTLQNKFKIIEITCDEVQPGEPSDHLLYQEREFTGKLEVKAVAANYVTDFVRVDSVAEVHQTDDGNWEILSEGKVDERMDAEHFHLTEELLLNDEGARVVGTLLQTAPDFMIRLYDRRKSQYLDISPMDVMPRPDLVMDTMDLSNPHCGKFLR